ncbi:MAG TPA: energy transducer TonB [Thermoanaerobaculia bacterium]|nr:energy transducer TonB [Thermoanaerobaculia bacterium]
MRGRFEKRGSDACQTAAKNLFLLSIASFDRAPDPTRAETLIASFFPECLEEEQIVSELPLRVGGDVVAPKLVNRVEPEYPESARRARLEGVVITEGIVATDGCVRDIRFVKSAARELDLSSVLALSRWRYRPALLDGRPVRVYVTVTMTFNLDR